MIIAMDARDRWEYFDGLEIMLSIESAKSWGFGGEVRIWLYFPKILLVSGSIFEVMGTQPAAIASRREIFRHTVSAGNLKKCAQLKKS